MTAEAQHCPALCSLLARSAYVAAAMTPGESEDVPVELAHHHGIDLLDAY